MNMDDFSIYDALDELKRMCRKQCDAMDEQDDVTNNEDYNRLEKEMAERRNSLIIYCENVAKFYRAQAYMESGKKRSEYVTELVNKCFKYGSACYKIVELGYERLEGKDELWFDNCKVEGAEIESSRLEFYASKGMFRRSLRYDFLEKITEEQFNEFVKDPFGSQVNDSCINLSRKPYELR